MPIYDVENSGGGAASPSWLQPGALVRFGVQCDDGTGVVEWLPFFTGTIESIPETTVENVDAFVTLNLVETTAHLAGWTRSPAEPEGGGHVDPNTGTFIPGDTLTQRMRRLLDDADWHAPLDVEHNSVGDLATFQDTDMSLGRLAEIQDNANACAMIALAGADGGLVVTGNNPPQSTVAAETFSNKPDFGQLPIVSASPYASTDRVINVILGQRVGGPVQEYVDYGSVDRLGPHVPTSALVSNLEEDTVVLAGMIETVSERANDSIGIEAVELDMDQEPVKLGRIMSRYASAGLTDRIPFNLVWFHPSGSVFPIELVPQGFTHNLTMEGVQVKWTTSVSTTARISTSVALWDDGTGSTGDYWDTHSWAFVS